MNLLNILKEEKLLPTNVVAERLKLSRSTVYRLIEEGKLKAVKLSKRNTRVPESSLKEYLENLNPELR